MEAKAKTLKTLKLAFQSFAKAKTEMASFEMGVVGSSPTRGATRKKVVINKLLLFLRPIGVTAEEARMLTALKFLRFQWKQKQKH